MDQSGPSTASELAVDVSADALRQLFESIHPSPTRSDFIRRVAQHWPEYAAAADRLVAGAAMRGVVDPLAFRSTGSSVVDRHHLGVMAGVVPLFVSAESAAALNAARSEASGGSGAEVIAAICDRFNVDPALARASLERAIATGQVDSDDRSLGLDQSRWSATGRGLLKRERDAEARREERARRGEHVARRTELLARVRLTSAGVLRSAPVDWVIEGLLMADSLAVLWGQAGVFKSFIAQTWLLDLAVAGHVGVYVAGEGGGSLGRRIAAYRKARGVTERDVQHALFRRMPLNLLDEQMVDNFADVLREVRPRLTVIDTLARSIAGGDENGMAMGMAADAGNALRAASGGCVLFLHHPTKDGSTSRGHSALIGAVDTEIRVVRKAHVAALTIKKQRDGQDDCCGGQYQLVPVDGTESCTAMRVEGHIDARPGEHDTVLDAIVTAGSNGLTREEVAIALNVSATKALSVLRQLIEAGMVPKIGKRGRAAVYGLVGAAGAVA